MNFLEIHYNKDYILYLISWNWDQTSQDLLNRCRNKNIPVKINLKNIWDNFLRLSTRMDRVILHVNKFHFNTPLGVIKCNLNKNIQKNPLHIGNTFFAKQEKFSTVELLRLAFMYYWCCPAIFDTHSEKGDQHFASGEVGFEAHAKSSH